MSGDLNPRFSFDTYVEGSSNRVACSAARSVAESPGSSYNPLFVFGPTGLGKTHLLMAIGQAALAASESLSVEYVTMDELLEAYQVAVATGHGDSFRSRFDGVDVLLLDDVQFLAHRSDMQSELLRMISDMQRAGRQVVLTSDQAPAEIEGIDEQLVGKFDGGLVVDVAPPDEETRLAILRLRAEERGADFAEGVLEAVADFPVGNVRELLGLLNRLAAFQAVSETPVTPDAARAMLDWEVLKEEPVTPVASPRTSEIVEDPFGLTPILEFPEDNEFDDFLSDVSHTVQEQVEAWKEQLARAILRWEPDGYRTARLVEAMNDAEVGAPVERVVAQFAPDVSRLQEMQEAIREVAPTRANDPVFYDPDRVADAERLVQTAVRELGPLPGPSEAFSVKAFLEAESNKVAVTAVHAAVEEPGRRYNPIVLIGTPGVGKTHLLHVTAHGLATREGLSVACLSAQQFIEELGQAIDAGAVEGLRSRFGRVGALLLDDLQLLGGHGDAQEEFFYIFNRLYEAHCQLVFTLNVPPAEVRGLDERIVSRLEGGLVATIDAPDRELRRAMIVHKLEEQYGAAELDLVDYLAARPAASIRAVQGMVQRVISTAEARGVEPNGTLARELIEGAQPAPTGANAEGIQTSGVWTPLSGIRSEEKVVWRWPDPVERMIEELG